MKNINSKSNIELIKDLDIKTESVNNKLVNKVNSQLQRQRQNFAVWRNALQSVESETNPNYFNIQGVFREISEDSSVYLNQTIRKNSILSSDFEIYKNENEDEKIEEFFEGKWFNDFLGFAMDSIFYGYSLIQISEIQNDMVTIVENINRQNVNPKRKEILKQPYDQKGVNYLTDEEMSKFLIFVSPLDESSNYLGLYNIIAPFSISKRNAISANNDFLSKFGIPNIIYKSDIQDEDYKREIESYLSNFSSLGYLYSSKMDEIMLLEPSNTSNDVFRNTINDCDSQISKIICGSDISTEKTYTGSIEAQMEILNGFYNTDKVFIENIVNNQLIPKLIGLGLKFLEGVKFEFEKEEEDNSLLFTQTVSLLQLGYQVDNEWIMGKFGIPVIGMKAPYIAPEKTNDSENV